MFEKMQKENTTKEVEETRFGEAYYGFLVLRWSEWRSVSVASTSEVQLFNLVGKA